ncbi:MAG TPA: metallophosphoesterase family protein [Tepidisphaeraceae bacterium]|nr:metallophosphoesterase family protein [Tepidisphaeraceae bacterium]
MLQSQIPPKLLRRFVTVLCVALAACWSAAASAQDMVGLYLTWVRDPSTTVVVNWVDLYPDSSDAVYYRQAGEKEWRAGKAKRTRVVPSALQRRHLELEGLKPDTVYELAVAKKPEKAEEAWTFRTMPAELNRPVRFITGGDMMHNRRMLDRMSAHVGGLEPDFVMFGGDMAYENGANATKIVDFLQSWMEYGVGNDRRLIPVVAVIGNHEVRGGYGGKVPVDAPYYYGLYSLPDGTAYYTLDFGKYLSLIALDSGHTNEIPGEQAAWLDRALAARHGQTFLFACYHYPAYGTTKAPTGRRPIDAPRSIELRRHWVPLFDRHGVTAVFENDHHNFKRTHPLRGDRRDDKNGILYLGDGCWGVEPRTVPKPGTAWWLAKAAPRNHFWIIDLRPNKSVTVRAMGRNGKVFDEVKLPAPRTRPMD